MPTNNAHRENIGAATSSLPSIAVGRRQPGRKHLPCPPEIRNRIYKYALTYSFAVPINMLRQRVGAALLALLLVSRTTFFESFHIFYNVNKILLESTNSLLKFLKRIGNARRREIGHLSFNWAGRHSKEAFQLLKSCSKLKTLEIKIPSRIMMPFAGYETLGEIRGLDAVSIDMRRNWHGRFRGVSSYSGAWDEGTWGNYLHGLREKMLARKRQSRSAGCGKVDPLNRRLPTLAARSG